MKKLVLLLLVITGVHFNSKALAPVIRDLRALLESAKTNFNNDMGEKIEEDTANKMIFYKTKAADYSIVSSYIIHRVTDGKNGYSINYNVKDADVNTLELVNTIVDLYINELNAMVKTGKYTGRDYIDGDMSVTEIKDLNGNHILDYTSNKEVQRIVIYSIQ